VYWESHQAQLRLQVASRRDTEGTPTETPSPWMEWNISGSSSRFPADFEHFYNLNPVTKYLAMFPRSS